MRQVLVNAMIALITVSACGMLIVLLVTLTIQVIFS